MMPLEVSYLYNMIVVSGELYLVSCMSYAYNIRIVSDAISSRGLRGLQADLRGGRVEPPSGKNILDVSLMTAADCTP